MRIEVIRSDGSWPIELPEFGSLRIHAIALPFWAATESGVEGAA
jgi:hypothetical protein